MKLRSSLVVALIVLAMPACHRSESSADSGVRGTLYLALTAGPLPTTLPTAPPWEGLPANPVPHAGVITLLAADGTTERSAPTSAGGQFRIPADQGFYTLLATVHLAEHLGTVHRW